MGEGMRKGKVALPCLCLVLGNGQENQMILQEQPCHALNCHPVFLSPCLNFPGSRSVVLQHVIVHLALLPSDEALIPLSSCSWLILHFDC